MTAANGMGLMVSRGLMLAALVGLCLGSVGCEDEDRDFDHEPASGKGALIVDNLTSDDIDIYVDGRYAGRVDDDEDRAFDLAPDVHRIVLEDEDNDRFEAVDADILEDRLTVLTVRRSSRSFDRYDVSIDLQD